MHHVEKKVYNISNIGWIYAPFLEKGAYINELATIIKQKNETDFRTFYWWYILFFMQQLH